MKFISVDRILENDGTHTTKNLFELTTQENLDSICYNLIKNGWVVEAMRENRFILVSECECYYLAVNCLKSNARLYAFYD